MAEKILLVEDEEKLARMVELELRYEGYEVEKAFDGRTGLERALSGEHDLILLDIMLPALSGMEVLRRLRYDRATTEFVMQLVAVHGRPIPDDLRGMRRMLARLGAPVCRALIQLRCADAIGTGTADAAEQTARCEAALSLLAQAEKGCSSVSTLAVSGRDLLALGMTQGPAVGAVLKRLLDAVLDGSAPNDRASLLKLASEIGNNA